ncbi:hypothetical protein DFH06DRAFT_1470910 [Mycena polygramma]|nr:hypothetical protein DFH06DRAFT_1470910 [Mycena polygramma]
MLERYPASEHFPSFVDPYPCWAGTISSSDCIFHSAHVLSCVAALKNSLPQLALLWMHLLGLMSISVLQALRRISTQSASATTIPPPTSLVNATPRAVRCREGIETMGRAFSISTDSCISSLRKTQTHLTDEGTDGTGHPARALFRRLTWKLTSQDASVLRSGIAYTHTTGRSMSQGGEWSSAVTSSSFDDVPPLSIRPLFPSPAWHALRASVPRVPHFHSSWSLTFVADALRRVYRYRHNAQDMRFQRLPNPPCAFAVWPQFHGVFPDVRSPPSSRHAWASPSMVFWILKAPPLPAARD